mmetsp:Transcript_11175/g.38058  ORF Transcript_11175/g.38058 Transcript_11175/m.38058 type:complete len:238 (-) Transcript_11175:443-1156(-)
MERLWREPLEPRGALLGLLLGGPALVAFLARHCARSRWPDAGRARAREAVRGARVGRVQGPAAAHVAPPGALAALARARVGGPCPRPHGLLVALCVARAARLAFAVGGLARGRAPFPLGHAAGPVPAWVRGPRHHLPPQDPVLRLQAHPEQPAALQAHPPLPIAAVTHQRAGRGRAATAAGPGAAAAAAARLPAHPGLVPRLRLGGARRRGHPQGPRQRALHGLRLRPRPGPRGRSE